MQNGPLKVMGVFYYVRNKDVIDCSEFSSYYINSDRNVFILNEMGLEKT